MSLLSEQYFKDWITQKPDGTVFEYFNERKMKDMVAGITEWMEKYKSMRMIFFIAFVIMLILIILTFIKVNKMNKHEERKD